MNRNSQYDEYLTGHISNVQKAYEYLKENILAINNKEIDEIISHHDASKYSEEEYDAYANYFYGDKNQEEFDKAWLHHQKANPHHWQYWVLINDEDGTYATPMDYKYIIEMICDWWSFSWSKNKLDEIFNWYKNQDNMILHDNTRKIVDNILNLIAKHLEEKKALELMGI